MLRSRCPAIPLVRLTRLRARQALDQLLIATPDADKPVKRAIELFHTLEIYPGSKLKHFKELHRKVRRRCCGVRLIAQTGIAYSEMLFFGASTRASSP